MPKLTTILWLLWVGAVAVAVMFAHARRKVMRDAKDANLFLRDMGAPTGLKVKRKRKRA